VALHLGQWLTSIDAKPYGQLSPKKFIGVVQETVCSVIVLTYSLNNFKKTIRFPLRLQTGSFGGYC